MAQRMVQMSSLNRRRGKENERILAKRLGGRRLGTMGKVDVEIPGFAVECKEREIKRIPAILKKMPQLFIDGLNQAKANKINGEKQLPVLHVHQHNAKRETDVMIMYIADWKKMYRKYRESE
jgi:hypothetical protein